MLGYHNGGWVATLFNPHNDEAGTRLVSLDGGTPTDVDGTFTIPWFAFEDYFATFTTCGQDLRGARLSRLAAGKEPEKVVYWFRLIWQETQRNDVFAVPATFSGFLCSPLFPPLFPGCNAGPRFTFFHSRRLPRVAG